MRIERACKRCSTVTEEAKCPLCGSDTSKEWQGYVGKWVPVKAGDLHFCPRGVAHATRALPGKELLSFNIFTPPQPKGAHDRVMIDE